MSDRILLLHGLEDATNTMAAIASQAGYRVADPGAVADVLCGLQRDGMGGLVVESAGPGSLERLMQGLREMPETLRPYVLVLDESADERTERECLRQGADDVIHDLPGTERFGLRLRAAIRYLQLQYAFCRHALHDPLTGILNRGAVMTFLDAELQRARRMGYSVAVVMADFDKLKTINDTHGHQAGDAAMCAAAARIKGQLRPYDAVGRYGGDEFILILSNCGEPQARDICQRIQQAVTSAPVSTPQAAVDISLSMGAYITDARNPGDAVQAIRQADTALYQAKRAGGHRVVVMQ